MGGGSMPELSERRAGVLMHLTSLPGPHGCGGLGAEAERFVEFLAEAGQSWWQMLPVGPPGYGNGPYMATSAFALSPLLLSLDELSRQGRLQGGDLDPIGSDHPHRVDYATAERARDGRLRRAAEDFTARAKAEERAAYRKFCEAEAAWLDDHALFCALKEATHGASWTAWEGDLRRREPAALERARRRLAPEIARHKYIQFELGRQWGVLRDRCRASRVGLIGDLPIFVAHESSDVWAHPDAFWLDEKGRSTVVAGVPPDYFSRTGQRWGHPLYRWDVLRARGYGWWMDRLARTFELFDAIRLDHFIGFVRYWEIPASCPTAVEGRWVAGPGEDFFHAVIRRFGGAPIIAEDLGLVTPEVIALRERFQLPGMRVLQFAFGGDPARNPHLPHSYMQPTVVYTGTHDNDTTAGWYRELCNRADREEEADAVRERAFLLRYAVSDGREIHWDLIRLAHSSCANLAVIPMQDLLGLGSEARMNLPSAATGNWEWRMEAGAASPEMAGRLRGITETYVRAAPAMEAGEKQPAD